MAGDSRLKGARILILDDELAIAMALRDYCLIAGAAHVDTSSTVQSAIELAQDQPYDAALLDLTLPDGSALGLASRLAEQGVRILFHSGKPLPEVVRKTFPQAIFMQKPSDPDALIDALALDK